MKTTIIILAILGSGIFIAARSYQKPVTTEVDVLGDVTDIHLAQPNGADVLRIYNLSGEDKCNGAILRFSDLSDVSYNRTAEAKIEPVNKWFSNELERDKEIETFKNEISKVLSDSQNDSIGKRNSSVYIPIARELNHLSQSKASGRVLLVYSDLMENDSQVSFYKRKDSDLLESNPDSLKNILEQWQPLPNSLNGIEVYLIYQPYDIKTDNEFRLVSAFYKKILEEKGATVNISANL